MTFFRTTLFTPALRRAYTGLVAFVSGSGFALAAAPSPTPAAPSSPPPLAPVMVQPYVPEPHDGIGAILAEAGTPFFRSDFSPPAVKWAQAGARGRVPAGWADFTTAASARGSLARIVLHGVPMLRITKENSHDQGPIQAGIPMGTPGQGLIYKISLASGTRTPTRLLILPAGATASTEPLWSRAVPTGIGQKRSELYWEAPAGTGPVDLVLSVGSIGECDVSELTVETIARRELQARLEADAGGDLSNALHATRFPLGLPPRWYLDRGTSDDERPVAADPAVPGPSGVAALHIPAPPRRAADQARAGSATLCSGPFAIASFWAPQVASLSIRGEGAVTIGVRSGFDTLSTETFTVAAADGWRRVGVPFHPRSLSDECYLQITVNGECWLDGLRVAAGSINTPGSFAFVPSARAEVALASPSPARVMFADDPDDAPGRRVEWEVLPPAGGFPTGSVLRAKVVNIYDQQIVLPASPLTGASSPVRGQWLVPAFPGKPCGAHRVEAWAEDAAGKRLSPVAELVVYRLPRPRYWGRDAEESAFGVHITSTRRHLEMVKAIGANWVRLHDAGIQYVGWYFLEKERGHWAWDDAAIRRYRDHHLMILGQLGTAPGWATALHRVGRGGWLDRYYRPEDMAAWENYVRTITKRYRDEIRYWDVWNEPWSIGFWKADAHRGADGRLDYIWGDDPPAAYAALSKDTAATAHAVDPDLKIVGLNSDTGAGGNPARRFPGAEWTRRVADAGGLEGLSAIDYHQYLGGRTDTIGYEGDWVAVGHDRAVGGLVNPATGRPPLPVWMTEGSAVQSLTGRGFYYHSEPFPGGEDRGRAVSDHLLRYIVSILSTGTKKVFLYSSHKYGFADDGVRFRALLSEDGYLHPSAVAYAALARRIDGRPFVKALQLTPDTRAYVFADRAGGGWAAVLVPRTFDTPSTLSLESRGSLRVDDIFGNPLPAGAPAPRGVFFAGGDGAFAGSSLDALRPVAP